MARIRIEDVSVDFPLYHGSARSLKKTVFAAASGRLGEDTRQRVVVQALRDVELRPCASGDRLGPGRAPTAPARPRLLRAHRGHLRAGDAAMHPRATARLNALIDPQSRHELWT